MATPITVEVFANAQRRVLSRDCDISDPSDLATPSAQRLTGSPGLYLAGSPFRFPFAPQDRTLQAWNGMPYSQAGNEVNGDMIGIVQLAEDEPLLPSTECLDAGGYICVGRLKRTRRPVFLLPSATFLATSPGVPGIYKRRFYFAVAHFEPDHSGGTQLPPWADFNKNGDPLGWAILCRDLRLIDFNDNVFQALQSKRTLAGTPIILTHDQVASSPQLLWEGCEWYFCTVSQEYHRLDPMQYPKVSEMEGHDAKCEGVQCP